MDSRIKRPYLILIPGEKGMVGPGTRLGLYERFPAPNWAQLSFAVITKLMLLATVFYVCRSLRFPP